MRPNIPFFTLDEVKVFSLKILASNFFNKYVSLRQLADRIIVDKHDIPERCLFTECEYTPLQRHTKKQLNHVFREFKKLKYLEKFSNRFWIINKDVLKRDKRLNE